eukprot:GEMP01030983.1.p1 GENE.GEMP01030983.1~~GEMP01030983.1.p1  ORF type:complete len:243 (+),score=68.20 GEMP01030983.1:167-895(+)
MLDADTWVNIILAIAVIVILIVARRNEERNEGERRVSRHERKMSAREYTAQPDSSAPIVQNETPECANDASRNNRALAEREGAEERAESSQAVKPGEKDRGDGAVETVDRQSSFPEDLEFVHKRGSRIFVQYEIGSTLDVPVRELHFTRHKCKIKGEPPTMAQMMKWTAEQFRATEFLCARWQFGEFSCWAADGNFANRMLYVMKKKELPLALVTVVPPPVVEGDDYPETVGADFSKIQLIP